MRMRKSPAHTQRVVLDTLGSRPGRCCNLRCSMHDSRGRTSSALACLAFKTHTTVLSLELPDIDHVVLSADLNYHTKRYRLSPSVNSQGRHDGMQTCNDRRRASVGQAEGSSPREPSEVQPGTHHVPVYLVKLIEQRARPSTSHQSVRCMLAIKTIGRSFKPYVSGQKPATRPGN